MKKFGLITVIATLVIIVGGVFFLSKSGSGSSTTNQSPPPLPQTDVYYWGDGCPHCKAVQDFIDGWDKKDLLKIDKKEVWYNKVNANEMKLRAEQCGLDPKSIGVPLLFTTEGKCINGDTPIIDYFKGLNL